MDINLSLIFGCVLAIVWIYAIIKDLAKKKSSWHECSPCPVVFCPNNRHFNSAYVVASLLSAAFFCFCMFAKYKSIHVTTIDEKFNAAIEAEKQAQ